jgi:ADP-ribose pyrophosphatase
MDKPNAFELGWHVHHTEYPYRHHMFRIRTDLIQRPDGATHLFSYMEGDPVVMIVPVTTAGEVVLIRQYRYVVDAWSWELPAGGSHDFEGDDLLDLARLELYEEVGGEAETWEHLGECYPMTGMVDKVFHIYLATDVVLGAPDPEPWEQIEVHPTPLPQALTMARSGEMIDAACAYALLRCEPLLQNRIF